MKGIKIGGQAGESRIMVGERLESLKARLGGQSRLIIITDHNVEKLYADQMPGTERIVIGTGEAVKTLDTASEIYRKLIQAEADRGVFLLGVGGGIVCDITGFVAATYMRGVRFANVATTLLAQVDASVGGKTGVNFNGYKNMVGVFNQPSFVTCDPLMLKTLPNREIANGFAEIIKHAAICDAEYFARIENQVDQALALEPELMEKIIYDSVVIKADIVNRDERERGERRKLNFGHTLGHAVEKTSDFLHGEAVSIGMSAAAMISVQKGFMEKSEAERLKALLARFGLPVDAHFDPDAVFDALSRDKKRLDESIHFVLLAGIGRSFVEPVRLAELKELIKI